MNTYRKIFYSNFSSLYLVKILLTKSVMRKEVIMQLICINIITSMQQGEINFFQKFLIGKIGIHFT